MFHNYNKYTQVNSLSYQFTEPCNLHIIVRVIIGLRHKMLFQ